MIASVLRRARRLRELQTQIGTRATARYVLQRLRKRSRLAQIDVLGFYSFITHPAFGTAPDAAVGARTINWFIPDFDVGSGGHLNIFRLAWNLEQLGYTCRMVIVGPCRYAAAVDARNCIRERFVPLQAEVVIGTDDVPPAFFAVATSWITAYYVRAFRGAERRIYFVQDYEPYFYSQGSDYLFAENTYRFGFFGITAGGWLAAKLAAGFGMRTRAIGFAAEPERYTPRPRREPEIRRVFFYARPPTPRRALEMGFLVLGAIAQRLPDVKFILAGWDVSQYKLPFEHHNAGTVALDELADLYSQCDVALVLSCTNASLLPLELMACGCPVVSNNGANVEWLLEPDCAVLADFTVEALSEAVIGLLEDDAARQALSRRGLARAQLEGWDTQARAFADGLEEAAAAPAGTP